MFVPVDELKSIIFIWHVFGHILEPYEEIQNTRFIKGENMICEAAVFSLCQSEFVPSLSVLYCVYEDCRFFKEFSTGSVLFSKYSEVKVQPCSP